MCQLLLNYEGNTTRDLQNSKQAYQPLDLNMRYYKIS